MYKKIRKIACKRHFKLSCFFTFFAFAGLLNTIIFVINNGFKTAFFGIGMFVFWLLLAFWQITKYRNIKKSNVGKKLAKYYPDKDLDTILEQLELELEDPQYNTKQMIVTDSFVIGKVGRFGKEAVIPASSIMGIYTCHEIHRGKSVVHFYEVILIDPNLKIQILQLKNEDQMIDAALEIKHICPNANSGGFDDYQEFWKLSKEEQQSRVQRVLTANKMASLTH